MKHTQTEPLISFEGVALGYGERLVVKDLSFVLYRGDFLGMVGPNGSGKTTIVRALLGTLRPKTGVIRRGAHGGVLWRTAYVPQRDTIDLIMPYTVEDVVMMGRYKAIGLLKRPRKEDRDIVHNALKNVGVGELTGMSLKTLSGGQKQRVLIARALASEPDVLILDEPTNGMDLSSRTAILELVKRLHVERRLTVVMVSHLLSDVANYVKRIALVEQKMFQIGDPADILTSANLSRMYGIQVRVDELRGQKIVIPKSHNG